MGSNEGGLGQAPLARASLVLGIVAVSLVFGIGLCAITGAQQGWLQLAGTPLYVCGASAAFLGLLAGILGAVGALGKGSRGVAIVGLVLGGGAICLFMGVLRAVAGG